MQWSIVTKVILFIAGLLFLYALVQKVNKESGEKGCQKKK